MAQQFYTVKVVSLILTTSVIDLAWIHVEAVCMLLCWKFVFRTQLESIFTIRHDCSKAPVKMLSETHTSPLISALFAQSEV